MSNLFTGKIVSTDYGDLFGLAELVPTTDTKYSIQIRGGIALVREGSTGKGFLINDEDIFEFTQGEDTLYIKTNPEGLTINIASK